MKGPRRLTPEELRARFPRASRSTLEANTAADVTAGLPGRALVDRGATAAELRAAGVSEKAVRSALRMRATMDGDPEARPAKAPKRAPKARGGMNATEAAFFELLRERVGRGEFREVAYEPFALPIEGGMTYTPDFVAVPAGLSAPAGFPDVLAGLRALAESRAIEAYNYWLQRLIDWLNLSGMGERIVFFEVKGAQVWAKNANKFKQARERYGWARFEMWQRVRVAKGEYAWREIHAAKGGQPEETKR